MLCRIAMLAYLLVCLAYWARIAYGALRVSRLPRLSDSAPPESQQLPKLSVVIAARDEADKITPAAETLLSEDCGELEIILVDDRSTDGTGEAIDALAARDERIRPVHIGQLPAGWLGKVNALNEGLRHSSGEFVLFSDADVHFGRGTLCCAAAYCQHRGLDHLVACPTVWSAGIVTDAVMSSFLRQFLTLMLPPWRVNDAQEDAFFGIGAFNMVRRSVMGACEGFDWLKMETADDVGLGLLLRRAGAKAEVISATDRVGLHWYRSLAEAMRGAEKAFASAGGCSFWRMATLGLLGMALEISPLAAAIQLAVSPVSAAGLAGGAILAAFTGAAVLLAKWARVGVVAALLTPLTSPISAAMAIRAGWLGWRRGGIDWRGTLYSTSELRAGSRVRAALKYVL